jgi:5'-AMP-activated protein kinase regulatory beta subunit
MPGKHEIPPEMIRMGNSRRIVIRKDGYEEKEDVQMATKKSYERVRQTAAHAEVKGAKKIKKSRIAEMGEEKEVQFVFEGPEANQVYLVGEFNQWNNQSIPMKKDRNGTWKKKMKLVPGRYEYQFLVDGNWTPDVSCPEVVINSFGTKNCVLRID